MSETISRSVVVVYSSPSVANAELIRSLLANEGIHASTTEINEPFAGLPEAASEVVVWSEDEGRARELIQRAELNHQQRVAKQAEQSIHEPPHRAPKSLK